MAQVNYQQPLSTPAINKMISTKNGTTIHQAEVSWPQHAITANRQWWMRLIARRWMSCCTYSCTKFTISRLAVLFYWSPPKIDPSSLTLAPLQTA